MATILRSSRYIRCLNCFTRRITVAHDKSKLATKCIAIQAQCISSYLTKNYATAAATQRRDVPVNFTNIFNSLDFKVQRYGRVFHVEIEDVLAKIRETGYIPSLDALLLIRCCGDLMVDTAPAERNHLVQEIWSTLNTLKIPMDVSHFNALLRVYLENGYNFSPIEFLTNLKEKGVEPNRVTYQRLIMHYCNHGDIIGATKILEFMKEKEIPLTEGVFNALITGHSEANDMESAKNILNIMKEVDVAPSSTTYTALLRAYAKKADMESIRSMLQEISEKDFRLQDSDYLEVIQALAANGHNNEVDEILSIISAGPNYNTEAVHAILKILDVGNVDVALKILRTMQKRKNEMEQDENVGENSSGTFLIRKLVNSKYPAETIIKACTELEQQGNHLRALDVATERALANENIDLGMELLKGWKANDGIIREHYFWPVIVGRGKANNYQGIYDTLQFMVKDFNLKPGFETIKDYVLPYTVGKWDETVATMKEFQVPHATIVSAIANRMLMDKKIRKTAMFMTSYSVDYEAEPFYRPLADALNYTGDAKSFVVILRFLYDTAIRVYEEKGNAKSASLPEEVIDGALRTVLAVLSPAKSSYVDDVLTHLVEAGITITPELGNAIRTYFQENATQEINAKIIKLTSGTLELTPLSEFNSYGTSNAGDEFNTVESTGRGGAFSVKRRQLAFTLRTGNIEAIKSILDEMESLDFKFSPALCAQIIDVACTAGDLEMAEQWVNRLRELHPNDELDLQKVTKYAILLVTKDRLDDALQFILDRPRNEDPANHPPQVRRMVKQLLDVAAETGNVEKTNQLFDALVEAKYITVDNFMVGPLIRVHLNRNDLEGALAAFEKACIAYQCTPLKNELSKKFIALEDANSLQRLTDLSTEIHGESNSLADLVLSFLECGRARQARKILETPGLRVRPKKLKACAERYLVEGKIECLTQFIDLTKNLQTIDRHELYDVFLEAYCKVNDWQRALSLWTEMQDENIQPNETFLATLADLLIRNNQPVPFVYKADKMNRPIRPSLDYVQKFRVALMNNDLDEAERLVAKVPSGDGDLSTAMSELVDEYVKKNNHEKACAVMDTLLLKHMRQPRASSLKNLWNAMIEAKKFDQFRAHAKSLSTSTKKILRFQKFANRAALVEHGLEKCLDDFISKISDSKEENLNLVVNTLHFTTYLQEFKKDPKNLEKFRPIAEKLADQDIYLPINMLWCYYFEINKPEAEELWSKYLFNSNWLVFNYLVDQGKIDNNVDLLERLNEKMWSSTVLTTNAKMAVMSNLIEVYIANKRYDDAVDVMKNNPALDINHFRKNHAKVFNALKDGLLSSGKSVSFELDDTRQQSAAVSNESKNISAVE